MKRLPLILLSLCALALAASAQETAAPAPAPGTPAAISITEAKAKADADLAASLKKLADVRAAVAKEEPAIAAEFNKVESELRDKRRLARLARIAVDDRRELMRELENTHYQLTQDASGISSVLKDHALRQDTNLVPGVPALKVDAEAIAAGPGEEPAPLLLKRAAVVQATVDRLAELIGGSTSTGEAVATDGSVHEGTFIAMGPESWFTSKDGKVGGAIEAGKNGAAPRILPGDSASIALLLQGKETPLDIDFTGKARLVAEVTNFGIIESIEAGGFWVYPILILGLVALAFAIIKTLQFSTIPEPGPAWMDGIVRAMNEGQAAKAQELAGRTRHPVGKVIQKAIQSSSQGLEAMEETIYEALLGVKSWATSLLPLIAVTAASAPLLGLLGTVSGMIRTFKMITLFGSGDPKPLAGGISEALTATAWGLVVAIPALLLHAFLIRRSQNILQSSERIGLVFVNGLRK